VSVSKLGYIKRIWIGEKFKGPLSPDDLVGLYIKDLFSLKEYKKILSWLSAVISKKIIFCGQILLKMKVTHRGLYTAFISFIKPLSIICSFPSLVRIITFLASGGKYVAFSQPDFSTHSGNVSGRFLKPPSGPNFFANDVFI
jgi:hypothetical protein